VHCTYLEVHQVEHQCRAAGQTFLDLGRRNGRQRTWRGDRQ
jgi:hypothetical protein